MKQNIGSLIHNTILYINMDESCEDISNSFKNFFKHTLVVSNIEDCSSLFTRLSNKLDLILLEASSLNKDELLALELIRNINKKIPIIFITNEITNDILIKSREYFIGSYLLRPFKVQELCKLSTVKISKYEKRLKNKNSLRLLSKQVVLLKEEKKEILKDSNDIKELLNFYLQFQENYLQLVKIDKKGIIKFVSKDLKKELSIDISNQNLIQLFENSSEIQNALISSLKERKINTVKGLVLKDKPNNTWTLNILPSSEEEKDLYSFNIFFYMTK